MSGDPSGSDSAVPMGPIPDGYADVTAGGYVAMGAPRSQTVARCCRVSKDWAWVACIAVALVVLLLGVAAFGVSVHNRSRIDGHARSVLPALRRALVTQAREALASSAALYRAEGAPLPEATAVALQTARQLMPERESGPASAHARAWCLAAGEVSLARALFGPPLSEAELSSDPRATACTIAAPGVPEAPTARCFASGGSDQSLAMVRTSANVSCATGCRGGYVVALLPLPGQRSLGGAWWARAGSLSTRTPSPGVSLVEAAPQSGLDLGVVHGDGTKSSRPWAMYCKATPGASSVMLLLAQSEDNGRQAVPIDFDGVELPPGLGCFFTNDRHSGAGALGAGLGLG